MLVTGGRTRNIQENLPTDIYDTEISEWKKFQSIGVFRHSCFIKDSFLFVYGGFENKNPNIPIENLTRISISSYVSSDQALQAKVKQIFEQASQVTSIQESQQRLPSRKLDVQELSLTKPNANEAVKEAKDSNAKLSHQYTFIPKADIDNNSTKNKQFVLANQAIVLNSTEDLNEINQLTRKVDIDQLSEESKRIGQEGPKKTQNRRLYNEEVIEHFLDMLFKPFDWFNPKEMEPIHSKLPFSNEDIEVLIRETIKIVQLEPTLVKVKSPVKVFGNLFGQYYDLMRFFESFGNPSEDFQMGDISFMTYVFLGDFCDRGIFSLEVVFLLFALKVKYPDSIYLLRGHHEDESVNKHYGLFEECTSRVDDTMVFAKINAVFDFLPLACLIDNKILAIHGGIGSNINKLSDIASIKRPITITQEVKTLPQQMIIDILYSEYSESVSDISQNDERDVSKFGFIVKFGKERLNRFLNENGLRLLITSHTWISEGVRVYQDRIISVYSSTNYMDKAGNIGGMIHITKNSGSILPKLIDIYKSEQKFYFKPFKNTSFSPIRLKK